MANVVLSLILVFVYDTYGRKKPIMMMAFCLSLAFFIMPFIGEGDYGIYYVAFFLLAAGPTI
jgi:hypothetical protein